LEEVKVEKPEYKDYVNFDEIPVEEPNYKEEKKVEKKIKIVKKKV
jgi:hypothetical protein